MEENLTNVDKKVHLIANAHLDPILLCLLQEGCGEVLQTFSAACDRLDEYDDFIFTCFQRVLLCVGREIDPNLFARITKFVKEGRWVPDRTAGGCSPTAICPPAKALPVRRSTAAFLL